MDKINNDNELQNKTEVSFAIKSIVTPRGYTFSGYAGYDRAGKTWRPLTIYLEFP